MKRNICSAMLYSLLLSILYGTLFIFYYVIYQPNNTVSTLYSILYSYAHGFEFAFFILIIALLTSWLPKYVKLFFWIIPSFILLLYIIIDLSVFKQFRYNLNFSMIQLFLGPASKEIFNFTTTMYIQFVIIVLVLLAVLVAAFLFTDKIIDKLRPFYIRASFITMLVLVLSYHSIHAYAHHFNYLPVMQVAYVLPQSYPLILKDVLKKYGIEGKDGKVENIKINNMHYPISFPNTGDNATKYNVLYIVLESWRFDTMTQDITPNIYKFSQDHMYFTNHNANANQTRHGIFSIFYGLPGNYWDAVLYTGTSPVIMDKFQKEGYDLGIFASSSLMSPEFDRTVFVKVPNLRKKTDAPTSNARDVKITEEFIDFLDNRTDDNPFFGFLFYDTPHSYSFDKSLYKPKYKPYSSHRNYINATADDREKLFNLYKNTLGYTDILVGRVLDELTKRDLLKNTIVIITGDHAEEFNDLHTNYWGHFGNYSPYQTHVPFIMSIPNKPSGVMDYETSHMDITPTIMKYAFDSTTNKGDYTIGYDLLDNTTRPYIFIKGEEYAIKYKNGYMIMKKYGLPESRDNDYNLVDTPVDSLLLNQVLNELKKYRK